MGSTWERRRDAPGSRSRLAISQRQAEDSEESVRREGGSLRSVVTASSSGALFSTSRTGPCPGTERASGAWSRRTRAGRSGAGTTMSSGAPRFTSASVPSAGSGLRSLARRRRACSSASSTSARGATALSRDRPATPAPALLDVHTDADHHRSVLTLVGEEAPARRCREAPWPGSTSDHAGVHPRFGVVDVVPFVPLDGRHAATPWRTRPLRAWTADELGRALLPLRPRSGRCPRSAAGPSGARPDRGPAAPHPTPGRWRWAPPVLVAYNVWLAEPDLAWPARSPGGARPDGPGPRLQSATGSRSR